MTRLIFHHDANQLSSPTNDVLPVQLYGIDGRKQKDIAVIGNPLIDKIKRLGVKLSSEAFDLLTIAMAVTAADTFVQRKNAADGWAREMYLQIPLAEPNRWQGELHSLEHALHFLSGDMWQLEVTAGGYPPPEPYSRRSRYYLTSLRDLDCVCLFSGGLDSTVGVIDLIDQRRKPLLVSHAYNKDKNLQDKIAKKLEGTFSHFSVNAHPVWPDHTKDITMRTRSFNFLAFGAIGACALAIETQRDEIELFVPENGFISLNAPLTALRTGTLSTRTTHPHFLSMIQKLFDRVGIQTKIKTPYKFKTKGEMLAKCRDPEMLTHVIDNTVSCSNWKRKRQPCGRCVPCLIRRASIHKAGTREIDNYLSSDLALVMREESHRDDLLSIMAAIQQLSNRSISSWITESGPLPLSSSIRKEYQQVFSRGLNEVAVYLRHLGLL